VQAHPFIARTLLIGSILCAGLAGAGCVRAMFVPPAGPGTPAPEAAAAWDEAIRSCRQAGSYVAALRATGRVGGGRLFPISLEAAVTRDDAIYLSATAAGRSLFVLAGERAQATLWLRSDDRAVTAPASDILNAIVDLPISPARLLALLTGCVARSFDIVGSSRRGGFVTIETADAIVHLEQMPGGWRARAGEVEGLVVEFAWDDRATVPEDVWIWTVDQQAPSAALRLGVTDPEVDGVLPAEVFRAPAGAATAQPMTIEELRAARPVGRARDGGAGERRWPGP
jgi:hypothetical protein